MAWLFVFVFGVCVLSWQVGCGEGNRYDEYSLMRLFPVTNTQFDYMRRFKDPSGQVEILKQSRGFNDSTDLLVPPGQRRYLEEFARKHNLAYDEKENYGRSFEPVEREPRRRVLRGFNLYGYNSYAVIQDFLKSVAQRRPDLVTLQDLGKSYQGRKMHLVKISRNPSAGNPIIFVDAGIHAREWVAPAFALYMIHRLTMDTNTRNNELQGVDWYILPVVNPDGYEFTRSSPSNRLWRKTRSKTNLPNCFGVDGNRNYGYKWGVSGISHNPCDKETYAGPRAFSEVETRMVRDVMMANKKRLKLYVSLHSYGQYLVYPWGYSGDVVPPSYRKLHELALLVSNAVHNAGGQPFKVLSAGQWYPASGGSDDFAFGAVGVPYSYTMELTEGHEFTFPEGRLPDVFGPFFNGFKTFGVQIRKEFCD